MIPLFKQSGPTLENQFTSDPLLAPYLAQYFDSETYTKIQVQLEEMGDLAANELYQHQLKDRLNEPKLTHYDAWGERIDHIEVTSLWQRCEQIAAEYGLIAIPYEQDYGELSRLFQFALVYLFTASNDVYSCPLAMSDGAARTLLESQNQKLIDKALPHLTSRDPQYFWTSGQWMTELTGGSDVGRTETIAHKKKKEWVLQGRKWFTSATTSQMALTLARPEGNQTGGKGLALFYIELRDKANHLQNIEVCRLKDKLGTRKVPTAELFLHDTPAHLVMGTKNGIKNISPMLNITRTWNSVSAISLMRRGLALAESYAEKRFAFGTYLKDKPLHRQILNQLEAQWAGAFHLTFKTVALLGEVETQPTTKNKALLRFITPITKLTTGKQAVSLLSEVLESFGGAGYVEDTGLPMLLRDAQVFPIWEGTTNVLSLDSLRALVRPEESQTILKTIQSWGQNTQVYQKEYHSARQTVNICFQWLENTINNSSNLEAGARYFALNIGHALELLLLIQSEVQAPEIQSGNYTKWIKHLNYHTHPYDLENIPLS